MYYYDCRYFSFKVGINNGKYILYLNDSSYVFNNRELLIKFLKRRLFLEKISAIFGLIGLGLFLILSIFGSPLALAIPMIIRDEMNRMSMIEKDIEKFINENLKAGM